MTDDDANDDDKLDLSAWDAPPPPADLADGVLARMGGTSVVGAVHEPGPTSRRPWLIAGVAAACLAATAGTVALVHGTHRAAPTSGSVIADHAQPLLLDTVRAELDPGAQVTWHRDAGALRVQQRAGTATWRVQGDDRLVIDAGATVASVEATGASLRVEVKMNQTDARVISGAAVTAAVVALVTVVVYEGHVKVSGSQGQPTVIVQPGSTYTVTPPPPPLVEPPVVGVGPLAADGEPDVVVTVGELVRIHAPELPVVVEIAGQPACSSTFDGAEPDARRATLGAGMHGYDVRCPDGSATAGSIGIQRDAASLSLTEPSKPALHVAQVSWGVDQTDVIGEVIADGTLSVSGRSIPIGDGGRFTVRVATAHAIALRVAHAKGIDYFVLRSPTAVATAPRKPPAPACNAENLRAKSKALQAGHEDTAALLMIERALECVPGDAELTRMAFSSACGSENAPKATSFFAQLSGYDQDHLKHLCIEKHVDFHATPPVAPYDCDAEAAKEKGMTNINMGQHAAALSQFEASLRCKDDPYVRQLAFMEACASYNSPKAKKYYVLLTRAQRTKFEQICIRQKPPVSYKPDGYTETDGPSDQTDDDSVDPFSDDGTIDDGYLQLFSKPAAKILIDGKDSGLTTPISGHQLKLAPGKHKVTFVIGPDRYTYFTVIEAGRTISMTKDLR